MMAKSGNEIEIKRLNVTREKKAVMPSRQLCSNYSNSWGNEMRCDCKGGMSFLQKQSLQQVVYEYM